MSEVTFNGDWYVIETPGGRYMSFDPEELDESYVEDQLWTWSRLLDYVRERQNDIDTES